MPKKIIAEIYSRYSEAEVINSIELIKQQNLERFPDDGKVPELKRQQYILEHIERMLTLVKMDSL